MKHWIITLLFLETFFFDLFHFGYTIKYRGPNRHKPHLEKNFIGAIYETSNEVLVQPTLSATDEDMPELQGLICDYQLYPMNKQETEIPFYVSVLDKATGRAKLLLKPDQTLEVCNNETTYHLLISALDCGIDIDEDGKPVDQRSSHKSHLDVTVIAENKHDPYFSTTNYFLDIEGDVTAGQPLLSFEAKDDDCFHLYGDICRYEIKDNHTGLFEVTSKGLLLSKTKISAEKTTLVLNMSVIAHDCGKRSSLPASINIKINPVCHPKWSGYPESVDFVASEAASVPLYAKPSLDTCVSREDVTDVQVIVSLDMTGVEAITGCDRDTYAARDARRLCEGTDQDLVELLPSYPKYKRLTTNFDKSSHKLPHYKREVAIQGGRVYNFNGIDQAIEVDNPDTRDKLNKRDFSTKFSVKFRLFLNGNRTSKEKSTILCKSDSTDLSRHHFSIYVQNCHLMVLIRRERGSKGKLNPAEWHWRLGSSKNCSGKWFQVLITVDFPNSTLFIDGVKQNPFLIADDYPLHPTSDPTKWSIGAAWQGRKSKYAQYFNGKLADVVVHLGALEDVRVMQCAGRCMEGLATDVERLDNSSFSTFTLHLLSNGSDVESVASQLERVVYFNKRRFPSGGHRRVKVQTKITCSPTAKTCPYIPPFQIMVDVLPPPDPLITIIGDNVISWSPDGVKGLDLHLFDKLMITSGAQESNATGSLYSAIFYPESSAPSHNLDSCVINKMGSGEGGVLEVRPKHLLTRNLLELEERNNDAAIRGIQSAATYQAVLRGVVYKDSHQSSDEIVFYLFCSELNGRYHSNVHTVTVIILEKGGVKLLPVVIPDEAPLGSVSPHLLPAPLVAGDRSRGLRLHEVDQDDPFDEQFLLSPDQSYSKSSANAAALVVGICVCGMVVVVLIITAHTKLSGCPEQDEEEEVVKEHVCYDVEEGDLYWDDSAMTITVNPMEEEVEDVEDASDYDFSEIDEDEVCDRDDREPDAHTHGKAADGSHEWDN